LSLKNLAYSHFRKARPVAAVRNWTSARRAADGRLFHRVAKWPMAKFSWLKDHGRVTICAAIPMATLQLPLQVRAMSQSPNPAAPQQVGPLLALATTLLRLGDQPMRSRRCAMPRCCSRPMPSSSTISPRLPRVAAYRMPSRRCSGLSPATALRRCIFPPGNRPREAGRHRRGNRCLRPRHYACPIPDRGVVPRWRPGLHLGHPTRRSAVSAARRRLE